MPISPLRPSDPTEIGGYQLAARIGAGGMGVVYLSTDPAGRPLAIKVISPRVAGEPDFRRRFRREVTAARAVGGACAVRVVAADSEAPRPWLATEYVAGASLAEVVEAEGPLPAAMLDALALGLAEALQAMHRVGVIHRDLKPSNVVLAANGPKVIDFGVSRLSESTPLTRPGSVLGSPGYMAPEQVATDRIGPATDVYSWALTVAFASTGRPPYGAGRPEVLIYRVIGEQPDLAGVPERLLPVLRAALQHDPAARPSAAVLLRLLLPNAVDPAEATARLLDDHWQVPSRSVQAAAVAPTPAPPSGPGQRQFPSGPGRQQSPSGPAQQRPPFGPAAFPHAIAPKPPGPPGWAPGSGPPRGSVAPPPPAQPLPAAQPRQGQEWAHLRARLSGPWVPASVAVAGLLTVTIAATLLTHGGGHGGPAATSTATALPLVTASGPLAPAPTARTPGALTPPAVPSQPASPTSDPAPPIALVGHWRGGYTCGQRPVGLLLAIVETPDHALWGTFEFYPVPANPTVARGSYLVRIIYSDGVMNTSAVRWINQPTGYSMVNLTARPRAERPDDLSGRVTLADCGTFNVHRQ
ncbi:serine/threonine-protein kinase [Frankia sp. AgKG'84/4]|uniref:serine/threonine-protein kinase n=1 Tax=Frankia sp. AgKG'84/4 TaxID=573490 RepID=UPI00200BCF03|nr:serine/threonine-protein kinase [Frankia sp. AgKG'84/4]MCL9793299.1 serine/threonine protein kinase [Frankia sp. AgKG'84/4]